MTKDELIAKQALQIANLEEKVAKLEFAEGNFVKKWVAVTEALGLSELSSEQTVTDRIKHWSAKINRSVCDRCQGMHYKAGESYRWCPKTKEEYERQKKEKHS